MRDTACSGPCLTKGQPNGAIDQECQIFVLIAEMREIMGQTWRRVLERRHGHTIAFKGYSFERLTFLDQFADDVFKRNIQL